MKKILFMLFSTGILFASSTINSDNTWGCITESKGTEMNNAIGNKDEKAMLYLINYGYCFILNKGQEVSIVDDSDSYRTKIRIYPENGRPAEIWIQKWSLSK